MYKKNQHHLELTPHKVGQYIKSEKESNINQNPCIVLNCDEIMKFIHSDDDLMLVHDILLICTSVNLCDKSAKRITDWSRTFLVQLPVYRIDIWKRADILKQLTNVLELLTNDSWKFIFVQNKLCRFLRTQEQLIQPPKFDRIIPTSEGLDSYITSSQFILENSDCLRLHIKRSSSHFLNELQSMSPLVQIPLNIGQKETRNSKFTETSFRSRSLTHFLVAGMVSALNNCNMVSIGEAFQGTVGVSLIDPYLGKENYGNHPILTNAISHLLRLIFDKDILFDFPNLWKTKGEVMSSFFQLSPTDDWWNRARSCWRDQRTASFEGKLYECGVCANCLLTRMSLYTANRDRKSIDSRYLAHNLSSLNFTDMFQLPESKLRKYHEKTFKESVHELSRLANLDMNDVSTTLERRVRCLSTEIGFSYSDALDRIQKAVSTYRREIFDFMGPLKGSYFEKYFMNALGAS